MKKLFSFVSIMGVLFLFWCANNGTTTTTPTSSTDNTLTENTSTNVPERQTYTSKTDWFSLQFPGTWSFQENVYGSSVMFSSPTTETDKIRENVGITKKPLTKEYTLDEYFTLTNDELKKQPNYAEVENTTIKINDIDAKKTIYKFSSNDTKIQSEQILLIKDKMLYTITYTATEATFNEYAQNFDEMVATLEIK